jgi:hypothetical protein
MVKQETPLHLGAFWTSFLRERKIALAALLVTVSIYLGLAFAPGYDLEESFISQHYDLTLAQGQALYASLSLFTFAVFLFAPNLRRYLRNIKFSWVILLLAGAISYAVVRLTVPDVGFHLAFYPPRIWWIIAGIVALNCLMTLEIGLALSEQDKLAIYRYVKPIVWIMFFILLALYIVSVGRYTNIEDFDEPWTATIATNYAQYGSLESTFGGPQGDILSPRYYVLMGLWLRLLGRSDLIVLRSFPTLVAILSVLFVAAALWRIPALNHQQRGIGLVAMLGSTPFLWSAHDLRPDIGLGLYSALVLLAVYPYFNDRNASKRWLLASGVVIYIGLESIPTYAISWGFAIGLLVAARALHRPSRASAQRDVAVYLLGCIIGIAFYGLAHFWPLSRLTDLSEYMAIYSFANEGRLLSPHWLLSGLGLMNAISPIETVLVAFSLIFLSWRGDKTDRWIAAIFWAGLITAIVPWSATIGYLALIAPFIGYTLARLCRTTSAVIVVTFVLLPSLISMSMYDIVEHMTSNRNLEFLDQATVLTEAIEENSTIIGDHQFWYILHQNREFVGWPGVRIVAAIYNLGFIEAVNWYEPDYVICQRDSSECQVISASEIFVTVRETIIQDQTYRLLKSI